ncbi:MAG: FprA family A-type flavoprotein [Actinomycetota bacterium]|nr:FprA family A-type flavoprotein [Actinomycetota bacterium]
MAVRQIKPDVYWVGAIDWDRRLFDELIPLPDGTSYNAYLVKGSEKTALIDTVDPTKKDHLFRNLDKLGLDNLDYVVVNHAEQDHSGTLPDVLARYPTAKIVTNAKCRPMLQDLLLIPDERFVEIKDRDVLSLGDRSLEFILVPWVHWPETMMTYLKEERVLFTCDFFGTHLATGALFAGDDPTILPAAKRYYAEIMMPYRNNIKKHLEKVAELDVDIIAPSHGPLHNRPELIIDAYRDWVGDQTKNEVVIAHLSMHGSTQRMVDYFIDALIDRDIAVKPFHLTGVDLGRLATAIVDASTIILASPTVLVGAHPGAVSAAYLINALRPKTKYASFIGSYGWGSKAVEQLTGMLSNLKVEIIEPVLAKGYPRAEDFAALDALADEIRAKHAASAP